MARENHLSDEFMPMLVALLKSRNGKQEEAQELLDDGKYIIQHFNFKFLVLLFTLEGKMVVTEMSRRLNINVYGGEPLLDFKNICNKK